MPGNKIKRSCASQESDSRTETEPVEADHRDIVCSHTATVIPAAAWITFDESDLNDAAGVDLGPSSHVKLLDALDQYRAVQSIPPLPPFSEVKKRLNRLAQKPQDFEKILKILPGEYPGINERKFRVSRQNVNYHLVQFLLAAGADLSTPPTNEQISHARESANFLHRTARPAGETTSGRSEDPGLADLVRSAIEIQRAAGGTGPAWRWSDDYGLYEGFLFDLINFLLSSVLLVDHLEVLNGAAPPPNRTLAFWNTFRDVTSIPDPVISEESVRNYFSQANR